MVTVDTTWIGFTGLKVRCLIGVLPHEHLQVQEIAIGLKMALAPRDLAEDALSSTIDYTQLANECRAIATLRHYGLLESLAVHLIECLCRRYAPASIWVRIEKPTAIAEATCAFVEHERKQVCDGL